MNLPGIHAHPWNPRSRFLHGIRGRSISGSGGALILARLSVLLLAVMGTAEPSVPASAPYLDFRKQTLEYHGPDHPASASDNHAITVGWFGPYATGAPGADAWWVAQFAVDEANAARDPNAPCVRLLPCWTEDPWGSGAAQLVRMVYHEKPVALLGSLDSAATHLAEQIVAKANLVLISPVATDKTATLAGLPWIFACAPSDAAVAKVLVDAILEPVDPPLTTLALLAATDHESRMLTREVMNNFSRRGRLPDLQVVLPPGAEQIENQLAALESAQPSAVIILASPDDAARWVIALRERLPQARLYGGPSFGRYEFLSRAGPAVEDVLFPVLFCPGDASPGVRRFREIFQARFGRAPDYVEALTYDATRLLLEALQRAGPRRAAMRVALADLSPWMGITGTVTFDGTGQNTRGKLSMGTYRNGLPKPGGLTSDAFGATTVLTPTLKQTTLP